MPALTVDEGPRYRRSTTRRPGQDPRAVHVFERSRALAAVIFETGPRSDARDHKVRTSNGARNAQYQIGQAR